MDFLPMWQHALMGLQTILNLLCWARWAAMCHLTGSAPTHTCFHPKGRPFQGQSVHSRFYQPPNPLGRSQCRSANVLSALWQSHNKYHSFIAVTGKGPALLLFSWSVSSVVTPWQSINIITYIPVDRKKIRCCCVLLHKSCFPITTDHRDEWHRRVEKKWDWQTGYVCNSHVQAGVFCHTG